MKFTLSWLKDHLDTQADLKTITDTLTAIGLEVESVTDNGAVLAPFTVAYVIKAEQHPNADKLRVCQVDIGGETVQVVCGAPNARTGLKAVFARSGLTVPATGLVLKPSEIRGVASNGMLVSECEMGLSDAHDGIIEMPEDAPLGVPFAQVLGLDDPLIEINITPNRQDCLGVRGIARDLAAAGIGTLKPVSAIPVTGTFKSPVAISLQLEGVDRAACPVFVGRVIRGVKNGPSPAWMQRRLKAIGLRPISALVDVTNYLSYDRARPLHVYDAAKLTGGIQVRLANPGEELQALDGKTYFLPEGACVIADDAGALGLGGVMGGEASGCTPETTDVVLESALFDPVRTAYTGRTLGINSDARYRFERGVDSQYVIGGAEDATRLILEICGGEASELVIAGAVPAWVKIAEMRPDRVRTLTGIDLPASESVRRLESLGFEAEELGGVIHTRVPSWRTDIEGEADLVEEVARIHGFHAIPSTMLPPVSETIKPAVNARQRLVRIARRVLAARGLNEAVTWSFTSAASARLFGGGSEALTLANPISSDLDCMRPSVLPNLVEAAGRNADRGFASIALFEVGPQYAGDAPEDQATVAGGVRAGVNHPRHWSDPTGPVTVFDAKADALALLDALGAATANLRIAADAPAWYHPGRSGRLMLGPKNCLAQFGELHPRVLKALDVKGPVVAFEVFVDNIPVKERKRTSKPALNASPFQAVERDFAFVMSASVTAADVINAASGADKQLIEAVSLFDVYEGPGVGEGNKSLAIAVRLQPTDRTLTDADIEAVSKKIVAGVEKATGGKLRG
jgi:phenylalanyl-tRNA synthetase beta chain